MEFTLPNPTQLSFGLRALKTVAVVDGAFSGEERALIMAAQDAFGADPTPPETITTITPTELAAAIVPAQLRFQLFGALVVMAMTDGDVVPEEADLIAAFADALGVEDAAVANLQRLANKQLRRARLDILRRQWAPRKLKEMAERDGVGVYYRAAMGMLRLRDDPQTIMRYQALGENPPGSLGRAYFDYMVANQFSFPGERGAPPEAMIFHDLTHILSGYGTVPEDEILVATFSAGYSSTEVIDWLVFVLCQFQLGLQTAPNVPPERLQLNPRRMIAAIRRGAAMNTDLNEGWDPWPLMGEQIDTVRQQLDIRPESDFL